MIRQPRLRRANHTHQIAHAMLTAKQHRHDLDTRHVGQRMNEFRCTIDAGLGGGGHDNNRTSFF